MTFNDRQTQIPQEVFDALPKDTIERFMDIIEGVPFIRWMVSPDRPRAKDLPRDDKGRIVVDVTKPHILENMDYFRPMAIAYEKSSDDDDKKCYTPLKPNGNPNSEYMKLWNREIDRIWNGMVRESDGEWIPGILYFYWNYTRIMFTNIIDGTEKGDRVESFPEPWDSTYLWAHYIYQAQYGGMFNGFKGGEHFGVIARRGIGKSYFLASIATRTFMCGENSRVRSKAKVFFFAYDKQYIDTGKDGTLGKFVDMFEFLARKTQFPHLLLQAQDVTMHWTLGYETRDGRRHGLLNEITGVSIKDKPGKVRGKRGVYTFYEEFGSFPGFLETFNTSRYNAEEGSISFGTIGAIGCVCAGTKVMDRNFNEVNIEDLEPEDGIIGFDIGNDCYSVEPITYMQDECYKECVEIATKNRVLRCSLDHPIYTRVYKSKRTECYKTGNGRKRWYEYRWMTAGEYLEHKNLAVIVADGSPMDFGDKRIEDPYFVGVMIGDGSYGFDKTPVLSNCDEEVIGYVTAKYKTTVEREYLTKDGREYKELRINNVCGILRDAGIYGQTKLDKRLPEGYENLDQECSAQLLAGLFDTDGCAYRRQINFCSINIEIIKGVQKLLRKFGINSGYTKVKARPGNGRRDKNDWYNLSVTGRANILKFRKYIPVKTRRKIAAIDNFLEKASDFYKVSDNTFAEKVVSVKRIGVQRIYNLTADKTHTYVANGIITHNTGGSKGNDFSGALRMIYHPRGYKMHSLPNVFDKSKGKLGESILFLGAYLNRKTCYDKDGNSDVVKAVLEVLARQHVIRVSSSDPGTLAQAKAEDPLTIEDAIMKTERNIYPVADLNARIQEIRSEPHCLDDIYIGRLNIVGGKVEFQKTDDTPIRDFPLGDNKAEGALEIYSMPEIDPKTGVPIPGRYLLGADVFDNDVADSLSLGSVFVLDAFTDRLVAEFTGRPQYAKDFYEICRRLCLFYNGKLCYENNFKGLYAYFSTYSSTHLLTPVFQYLKDEDRFKGETFGNTSYGVRATTPIRNYSRGLIREWLIKPRQRTVKVDGVDVEETYPQLMDIKNVALLKELATYDTDGNFDRHDALAMLMLYREDVYRLNEGDPVNGTRKPAGKYDDDVFFNEYEKMMGRRGKAQDSHYTMLM